MQIPRHRKLLKAKLDKWDPERVLTAAKLVRDLMAQPGWAEIQLLIQQTRDGHEKQMLEGPTLAQADYARMVGAIQGMRTLEDAAEAVFEKAREIDEENRKAVERQTAAEGA